MLHKFYNAIITVFRETFWRSECSLNLTVELDNKNKLDSSFTTQYVLSCPVKKGRWEKF